MRIINWSLLCVCFIVLTGCNHRGAHNNQFELIDEQDVIPEPVIQEGSNFSLKDSGFRYGLSDEFASTETITWRTRVKHALRGEWNTTYTHSTDDFIADYSSKANPIEIYRKTGRWPLPYALDTGDRLRVIVYSQRSLNRSYSVNDSGYISIPLVGQVKARGLSTKQVERSIARILRRKYLKDPKVSVEVATYRPFYVLGQVQTAGQFPYAIGMTAETAAAIAGGYTARADERKFRVSRVYKGRRYTLMVSRNFPIFPGDTVYVRERFF